MKHLKWHIKPNFDTQKLECVATLVFDKAGTVSLDSQIPERGIKRIEGSDKDFRIGPITEDKSVRGNCLRVEIREADRIGESAYAITIIYETAPNATALQWLKPEQTLGGRKPFLYSQAQCLAARSMVPCQDTPGVRFTVDITVECPKDFMAIAGGILENSTATPDGTLMHFVQEIPIPAYLLGIAIGDMEVKELSPRSFLYAERELVDRAANEFEDVEKLITAGEKIFGPYIWGHFNIVLLPLAFPFGGMEIPGAVFLSSSVAAGDKSQVEVVAHELAHHWTGNHVINSNWDHFWLNEGWTVLATYLIMREVFGDEVALLQLALMEVDLVRDLDGVADQPWLTTLKTELHGMDPLEVFSRVPYMKGCHFLRRIMEVVGEPDFLEFIKIYLQEFGGKSITTEDFLDFLSDQFSEKMGEIKPWRWCYEAGMPENTPTINSALLNSIIELAASDVIPSAATTDSWNGSAWTFYLSKAPRNPLVWMSLTGVANFWENPDVLCEFYKLALESGVRKDLYLDDLDNFLGRHGRTKYLKPLYLAYLKAYPERAMAAYQEHKNKYHSMAITLLEKVLTDAKINLAVTV